MSLHDRIVQNLKAFDMKASVGPDGVTVILADGRSLTCDSDGQGFWCGDIFTAGGDPEEEPVWILDTKVLVPGADHARAIARAIQAAAKAAVRS